MSSSSDLTAQERAMVVAWDLARGIEMTVADVRARTGLSSWAARRLLTKAERVLPVLKEGETWRSLLG